MADDSDIRIESWPKDPLHLRHGFEVEEPCPVRVAFDTPITVGTGERPLDVSMDMRVSAERPVPLCLTLCEPICARSDYRIDIAIFDQPVANIVIRGLTRLFNCGDEPGNGSPRETCVNADRLPVDQEFPNGIALNGLSAQALGAGVLRTVDWGDPPGRRKLAFPTGGIRIDLPGPCSQLRLTVNSYAGMGLDILIYAGSAVVERRNLPLSNEAKTVVFNRSGMTRLEIQGGMNEAAVVELCYTPEA